MLKHARVGFNLGYFLETACSSSTPHLTFTTRKPTEGFWWLKVFYIKQTQTCSWGDASCGWGLSGIVLQHFGMTLQQKGTQADTGGWKQNVLKSEEMKATGTGGNQETFGINQHRALHPERGNKHHKRIMNRMSSKQQHPVQKSKLIPCLSSWYYCNMTAVQHIPQLLEKVGKQDCGDGGRRAVKGSLR